MSRSEHDYEDLKSQLLKSPTIENMNLLKDLINQLESKINSNGKVFDKQKDLNQVSEIEQSDPTIYYNKMVENYLIKYENLKQVEKKLSSKMDSQKQEKKQDKVKETDPPIYNRLKAQIENSPILEKHHKLQTLSSNLDVQIEKNENVIHTQNSLHKELQDEKVDLLNFLSNLVQFYMDRIEKLELENEELKSSNNEEEAKEKE